MKKPSPDRVQDAPQAKTPKGSSESTKPDSPSPAPKKPKKKKSTPTKNNQTDKQIVTRLKDWKSSNPGKTVKNESELKGILGVGYPRIKRMQRDGIDLLKRANDVGKKLREVG